MSEGYNAVMKKKQRPLSYRRRRGLELWLAGGRKSKAKALREAGFSESVARQPHKVFGSAAVIEELAKRGYDEHGVRTEVRSITLDTYEPDPVSRIDFSTLSLAALQDLKEKLQALPETPLRSPPVEATSPQPVVRVISRSSQNRDPYSSM